MLAPSKCRSHPPLGRSTHGWGTWTGKWKLKNTENWIVSVCVSPMRIARDNKNRNEAGNQMPLPSRRYHWHNPIWTPRDVPLQLEGHPQGEDCEAPELFLLKGCVTPHSTSSQAQCCQTWETTAGSGRHHGSHLQTLFWLHSNKQFHCYISSMRWAATTTSTSTTV